MHLLDHDIAVVTGGGSGIGRAIAKGFAGEGARVAVLDINAEGAAETAREIVAAGGKADHFVLDVTDRAACDAIAAEIASRIGRASILVNNAAIVRRSGITGPSEEVIKDWRDIIGTNLNGMFNVTHAFLEPLRATKGRIINLGSIQSLVHVRNPLAPGYTTSKHAVVGFTRALAAELGKDGVRVNAIGPGFTATPLNAPLRNNHPERVQVLLDHTPLGRVGQPEDMVGPAIFLASSQSAYVTGALLMVDGGYHTV